MKKILSYNVNGFRAAEKKGFFPWLESIDPDIVCLQETKVQPEQLDASLLQPNGYEGYWFSAEKKGYSGVAIFTKEKPLQVVYGCGIPAYDQEGRVLRADFPNYSVMSLYLPSGSSGDDRQKFKEVFMDDFYEYIIALKKEIPNLIISGDYNICHQAIDIHDPVGNKNSSGFLEHERAWLSRFIDMGFVDSFRKFNKESGNYTWWSFRSRARDNNKGWRIDYHMVSASLDGLCKGASILPEAMHSDHCPIVVNMDV